MPPRARRRAVPQARDPRVGLARPPLPRRPSRHPRRPRALGARLGDHGRRTRTGASRCCRRTARWTRATSGRARIPDARGDQGQPLPQRGHRGGGRRGAAGARARRAGRSRRRRSTPSDATIRGRRAAADAAGRPARSTGARDDTATVLRKIRAADGFPGVRGRDPRPALPPVRRPPRGHAARRRTRRGHRAARRRDLPRDGRRRGVDHPPEARGRRASRRSSCPRRGCWARGSPTCPKCRWRRTRRSITRPGAPSATRSDGAVGFLHFAFYNGAMGTAHCAALREAYVAARARPTRVIVLMGGPDFWSNGIHLNLIEAADHPAEESWRNINAMDDLVREILAHRPPARPSPRCRATPARAACSWRWPPTASRARRRHPQPALQGHGQPLRLGVLDLPAAAPRRRRRRPRRSRRTACRSARGRPRRWASSTRTSAPIRPAFAAEVAARGPPRWPPIPPSTALLAAKRARRRGRRGGASRWSATAPRSSSG